jgi:threonine dehydrogenase-like Zn-dependent dehydrogenase
VYCHTDREQLCPQGALLGVTPFGSGPFPLFDRYHDGTLAEYVRVPWWLLDELPPHVSYEVGAHVHDLATALRALQTAGVPIGGTLLVTAATGGMGSAVVRLARHVGIGRLVLVGRDVGRLAAVAGLAGDLTVETIAYRRDLNGPGDADEVARLVRDRVDGAVHAVLDFSPAGHSAGLLGLVAPGGTLVHLGGNRAQVTLQAAGLMRGCVRVVGSRGYTRADSHQVLDLLRHGALQADHLISHRYPLAEINRAADEMAERREAIWLVVVEP